MQTYKKDFIDLALRERVLSFGEFKLKSGRVSPYFFNAGNISSGSALAQAGCAYAAAIRYADNEFDMLFGPAYKGIPLVVSTAIAYARLYDKDMAFAYNRKETKTHGERGQLVGAPLAGRVLIVDDVMTAGTAVREVIQLIQASGAELAGVVVGLDRQERGQAGLSAIQEIERDFAVPVIGIITLDDLLQYLGFSTEYGEQMAKIAVYRDRYGV